MKSFSDCMRRHAVRLFGTVALVVGTSGSVVAQTPDLSDVRREIERTNEVLERAAEIVPASRNPTALELLRTAQQTQQGAIEQLQAGHPRIAVGMTLEARRLAFRSIEVARGVTTPGPVDLEPRAQHAIEQAARHFEMASDCAGDPPQPVAQRILDLAAARLEEARQAFRDRRFRLALDLAEQSDRLLREVCRREPGEDADQLFDNVERLLERATPSIVEAGNPNALRLLDQARSLVERSRDAMNANDLPLARQSLRSARDLVLQALRLSERPPDERNVDRLLADSANDLSRLADEVRNAAHPEASTLMDRALEHLTRARELRSAGRLQATLAELRVARNLAWRAARLAGVSGL